MSIENHIRAKTNYLLRLLIIEDECFICKSREDLHLHHVKPFAIMLKEAHEILGIEYGEYDDYSKKDRDMVTTHMLGLQLESEYLTLCPECHIGEHKKEGQELQSIRDRGINRVEVRRKKKERQEDERVEKELLPYLIKNKGKVMLNMKDRQELIEMVNVRDSDNNRLIKGIYTINKKLAEYDLPFKVKSYSTSRIIDGEKKNFSAAWRISQTRDYIPDIEGVVVNSDGGYLLIGKEYKYTDLCVILKEEPKSGSSKPAQLNRWEKELNVSFIKEPRAYLKVVRGKK